MKNCLRTSCSCEELTIQIMAYYNVKLYLQFESLYLAPIVLQLIAIL
jgi:hypothetical protein